MRPLALLVLAAVVAAGCMTPAPPTTTTPPASTPPGPTTTPTDPTSPTPDGPPTLLFNETRALLLARDQVIRADGSVRYRVPGTAGNSEAAALIAREMETVGFDVSYRHFEAVYGCEPTRMHNVVAVLPGRSERVLYLAAHYDTRPIAEKDRERPDEPIQGAIDGAGAVGVLLELARALRAQGPLDVTLTFLFFDGEDGGGYRGRECTDWILGSRSYAANLTGEDVARADAFVLLDLIGAEDARFPMEGLSATSPHRVVTDEIWATAAALGHSRFVDVVGPSIIDDHVPFAERGIRSVDIIDLRERPTFASYHHTHEDTVDALHAPTMGEVGRTVERWVVDRYAG